MQDKWKELAKIEEQRSDILVKLERIKEKKDTVSQEVYEKVKKEYEEKLHTIDQKMSENVELIKEQLTQIEAEIKRIKEIEKKLNLGLEEIELRYSIGEYAEDDYNRLSTEHREKLEKTTTELEKLKNRRAWFEKFIDIKDIEETITKPATQEESESEVATEVEKPVEDIQIEEHILEEKLPEESSKLDELIVEEEAVLPEVSGTQENPDEATPQEETPTQAAKDKNVACPKCGHLNTPDSWYCEKCGAEILDSPVSD